MKDGKEDGKIKEEDCGAGHVVCKSVCKEGEGVSFNSPTNKTWI